MRCGDRAVTIGNAVPQSTARLLLFSGECETHELAKRAMATFVLTLDTYSDVIPGMRGNAAAAMDAIFGA
jgi:hypothetical protein